MNLKLNIQLISLNICLITIPFHEVQVVKAYFLLKQLIKQKFKGKWNFEFRGWQIQRSLLGQFMIDINKLTFQVKIDYIPKEAQMVIVPFLDKLIVYEGNNIVSTIKYDTLTRNKTHNQLPKQYNNLLYPYQRNCIDFCMQKHGRVLIADEMGIGKSVQALSVAYLYRDTWNKNPLVILCPSCLRLNWKDQILKWYKKIDNWKFSSQNIHIVNKFNENLNSLVMILIISYDMGVRYLETLRILNPQFVICDQAHYLKNSHTKRSLNLTPFLRSRKHILLLTGTPALSRPKQLFVLLNILRPDIYKQFSKFAKRYCDPKPSKYHKGIDYHGSSNIHQLHFILQQSVMIRRLKKDVLLDLPKKIRQKIEIYTQKIISDQISHKIQTKCNGSSIEQFVQNVTQNNQSDAELLKTFNQCYQLSGKAKLKGVCQYIAHLNSNKVKMLVYAHHISMMDQIQIFVKNSNIQYIRIDGSTPSLKRHNLIKQFQNKPQMKIAILSLTSCNIGINITQASHVVFAELNWTPGVMIQAEDRTHRLGQDNSVHCHYLIGRNTIDSIIFRKLENKFRLVSHIVDGKGAQYQTNEDFVEVEKNNTFGKQKMQKNQITLSDLDKLSNFSSQINENYHQQKIIQKNIQEKTQNANDENNKIPSIDYAYQEIQLDQKVEIFKRKRQNINEEDHQFAQLSSPKKYVPNINIIQEVKNINKEQIKKQNKIFDKSLQKYLINKNILLPQVQVKLTIGISRWKRKI